jgi:hypothetical protein
MFHLIFHENDHWGEREGKEMPTYFIILKKLKGKKIARMN